ncbi:MAG: T9SS type A sorting domain-containing protein [Bacteroidetes bacterium]|nr:MAG: T9SS type A sorting domain-containing protein [Bacteroidota bacterium]
MEKIMIVKIYFLLIIVNFISVTYTFALSGKGTKDEPFLITNIYEFQQIIEGDTLLYYKLINDIDASDTRNWNVGDHDRNPDTPDEPMGFKPLYFSGQIDGNGHIIKELFINRPSEENIGLFSTLKWRLWDIRFGRIFRLGLENCYIKGKIYVGSICGFLASDNGSITECYSTGEILANDRSGGFCGWNGSLDGIIDSYTSCTIFTNNSINDYAIASFSEGLNVNGNARKCYTIGKAISPKKVSNFGRSEDSPDCFWDIETTGIPDTGGHRAKGLPTSKMKKKATYFNAGWDFEKVWCIDEGKDYPKLRAFGKCPPLDVPLEPEDNGNKIDAFPNPASTLIDVVYKLQSLGSVQLIITNSYGQKVYNADLNNITSTQEQKLSIDISTFPSGLYFVTLRSPGVALTKGVVVVK